MVVLVFLSVTWNMPNREVVLAELAVSSTLRCVCTRCVSDMQVVDSGYVESDESNGRLGFLVRYVEHVEP
jgi:hypothetical protein